MGLPSPSPLREKSSFKNMLPNPTPLRFPNPMPFPHPTRSTPSNKLSRPPSLTNTTLPSTNPLPSPTTLTHTMLLPDLLPELTLMDSMEPSPHLLSHMPDGLPLLLLPPKLNNFVQ